MKFTLDQIKAIITEEVANVTKEAYGDRDPNLRTGHANKGRYEDPEDRQRRWNDNADRAMPAQTGIGIEIKHIKPVLDILHAFLKETGRPHPAEVTADTSPEETAEAFKGFFDQNKDLYDEIYKASKTVFTDRNKGALADDAHDKGIFGDLIDIDNFKDHIDGGRVLRSIMAHVKK